MLRRLGFIPALATMVVALVLAMHGLGLRINHTSSMPLGLYRAQAAHVVKKGDFVEACLQGYGADIAVERGYLVKGECVIKRVAALGGDYVDLQRYPQLQADSKGRPMPHREIANPIPLGMVFLVGENDRSFDSRYFGPVQTGVVQSVLRPWWVWTPKNGGLTNGPKV